MHSKDFYENKLIGITGGTGYLGVSFLERFNDISCRLRLLVRGQENFGVSNAKCQFEMIEGDIRDQKSVEPFLKDVDILFHFAGQTSLKFAEENPEDDFAINV